MLLSVLRQFSIFRSTVRNTSWNQIKENNPNTTILGLIAWTRWAYCWAVETLDDLVISPRRFREYTCDYNVLDLNDNRNLGGYLRYLKSPVVSVRIVNRADLHRPFWKTKSVRREQIPPSGGYKGMQIRGGDSVPIWYCTMSTLLVLALLTVLYCSSVSSAIIRTSTQSVEATTITQQASQSTHHHHVQHRHRYALSILMNQNIDCSFKCFFKVDTLFHLWRLCLVWKCQECSAVCSSVHFNKY